MNLKIGTAIRKLRTGAGITQEKLAAHLGVSVQAVSRWESETCYPDLEFIPKIANYFRVSADYLLGISRYDTEETANLINECETLVNIVLAECRSERLRCEARMYLITIKYLRRDRNAVKQLAQELPDVKCTKNSMLALFYEPDGEEYNTIRRAYLYELFGEFFYHAVQLTRTSSIPDEEKISVGKALLQILGLVTAGPPYGEFELYLDTLFRSLYECTGEEQYQREPDYYEKRYEALPAKFTYGKGFFKGYTFDHEQRIHSIDGSAG